MANILLVDDNPSLLFVMTEVLTNLGHQISTALNGKMAIELMEMSKYDLVITDLYMPEKDGMEILMELRQKYPRQKTIVMSGGGEVYRIPGGLNTAKRLGAVRTLSKPFIMKVLIDMVTTELNN